MFFKSKKGCCSILVALYIIQLMFCAYREFVPTHTDECSPYRLAVYRETPVLSYFPYLGVAPFLLSTHQIAIIDKPMGSGCAWQLRIDTGDGSIDWSETYMQTTNAGKRDQGVQVMMKGTDEPDYPILSAGDYFFHNL